MPHDPRETARRLLIAGLAGAHAAGIACVAGFALGGGVGPGVTAAIAAAIVIAFFTIGQAVQIIVARSTPRVAMFAALGSYTVRVTAMGYVLWIVLAQRESYGWIDAPAAVITTVLVAQGWLFAEFWQYRRLRIPAFDAGYEPPPGDTQGGSQGGPREVA
jgi:ATP synthase protein I